MTDNLKKEKPHPSRPKSSYKERPTSKTKKQKKEEEEPPSCLKCKSQDNIYQFSCPHYMCMECLFKYSISTNFNGMTPERMEFLCPGCAKGNAYFDIDSWINILEHLNREKYEKNKALEIERQKMKNKCAQHKDQEISCYCAYCKIWLCEKCRTMFHDRYYPDHELYDNEDIQIFCEEHQDTFIDFHCLKCQKDICSKCLSEEGSHNTHRYITKNEKNKMQKGKKNNSDFLDYKSFEEFDQRLESLKQKFSDSIKQDTSLKKQEIDILIKNLQLLQKDYDQQEHQFIDEIEKLFQIIKLSYFNYFATAPKERNLTMLLNNSLTDIKLLSTKKVNTEEMLRSFEKQINEYDAMNSNNPKNIEMQLIWDNNALVKDMQIPQKLEINVPTEKMSDEEFKTFLKKNEQLKETQHTEGITKILEIPHLNAIASASIDSRIMLWDLSKGDLLQTMTGHKSTIWSLLLHSTNKLISGSSDKTLKVWSFTESFNTCIITLKGHQGTVYSIAEFKDGKIISGSEDRSVAIWDIHKEPETVKPKEKNKKPYKRKYIGPIKVIQTSGSVNSLCTLIDDFVVTGESTNGIYLINVKGDVYFTEGLKEHGCTIWCMDVFDDGYRIVSGSSDNTIKIWDLNEWKCTGTLEGHQNSISALKILKNGILVSASWDFTMKLWNLSTMLCLITVSEHSDIIFSVIELEDGRIATSSKDQSIIVWKTV